MAMTHSTMLELGYEAPDFRLQDTDGRFVSLLDYKNSKALLVMFICNHCPYVKHVADELTRLANDYMDRGVGIVAINANDVESYPDDSPEKMKEEKERRRYPFPYLYDPTQEVAKTYRAACTPDFFLFDQDQALVYRGQLDDSRPGNDIPVTGKDLRAALDHVLKGEDVPLDQKPSIGCNIKWKSGNQPAYY